jgi:hypothetical protein
MYPSKGRSGNWILSLAFDRHNAASAREKRQVVNVTQSGLSWVSTFSRRHAFTRKMWCCCVTSRLSVASLLICSWIA